MTDSGTEFGMPLGSESGMPLKPDHGAKAPPQDTERRVTLAGIDYTVKPMTTRNALGVARTILGYGKRLQPAFSAFSAANATNEGDDQQKTIAAGLELMGELSAILDPDQLIEIAGQIIGQDADAIGEASIEELLNAIADAFEINDMPAIIKAAQRIWNNASRFRGRDSSA